LERLAKVRLNIPEQKKEENFAGQKNRRKAQAMPTESEQRRNKKLFRPKKPEIIAPQP